MPRKKFVYEERTRHNRFASTENYGEREKPFWRQETHTADRLWDKLRSILEQKVSELTIQNAIIGINRGIGEELVLRLKEISSKTNGREILYPVMPNEIIDAIMNYKEK